MVPTFTCGFVLSNLSLAMAVVGLLQCLLDNSGAIERRLGLLRLLVCSLVNFVSRSVFVL